jgi:CheY-like chemotaxis protein
MKLTAYYRCPDCGKVNADLNGKLSDPAIPLPCCSSTGEGRRLWPWQPVTRLLEIAGEQDIVLPGGFAIAVLFLSPAADLLLRGIIIDSLRRAAKKDADIDLLLGSGRDPAELLSRFSAHLPLGQIFAAAGVPAFPEKLALLGRMQRKLLKDNAAVPDRAEQDAILYCREHCLAAFAAFHNALHSQARETVKTVLVVDDELAVLEYMARLVHRTGFNVLTAANGKDAIELYRKARPHGVLLDVSLPDMDGLSILRQLREFDPAAVVYLVSGIGGGAFVNEALAQGAKGYLPKPVDTDSLINTLKKL